MKLKLIHITLIMIGIALSSCKKDPLPELPDQNNPYYTIKGLMNDDSLNLSVGIDNVTIINGKSEMNGLETYYGQLYSPNDNLQIRIEIVRPEFRNTDNGFEPIQVQELDFLLHEPGCISFYFGGSTAQSNYFLVKDENNDFVFMDQVEFEEMGIYYKTVKFTDYGSGNESFQVPVTYGFENGEYDAGFQAYGIEDTLMLLAFDENLSHEWYINGVLAGDDLFYSDVMPDGIYDVKHIMTDEYNNEIEYRTLIRFRNELFEWQLTYSYCNIMPQENNYNTVIISIMKDGVLYKTTSNTSNLNNKFGMNNIVYAKNSNFEMVYAIYDFAFDASLLNEDQTDSLSLSGMTGTFNLGFNQ